MLAELVDHVVGVDPDRDWITIAVLEARNAGVVAEGRFPATADATARPSTSSTATA
jgi:transposase